MAKATIGEKIRACALASIWFVLVYNFTNWAASKRGDLPTAAFQWELNIPFVPWLVIPYWSIDLFFLCAFFLPATRLRLQTLLKRVLWAVAIAGCFFLLFPLRLLFVRPAVDGPVSVLFGALDNLNNFYNLAPSLHIVLQLILWPEYRSRISGRWLLLLNVWFILIACSTVLVWQHQLIDIFFGGLLGAAVLHFIPGEDAQAELAEVDRSLRQNADAKIGLRYLALSVLFLLMSYLAWLPGFILIWPALSFGLVSAAYLGLGPSIFGRSKSPAAAVLFFPYRLLSRLWQSKYQPKIPLVTKLTPEVWFGRYCSKNEIAILQEVGVCSVLYLAVEYPCRWPASCAAKALPILDLTAPSIPQLKQALGFIDQARPDGVVLVQCALGLGRSALVAAAWLIHCGKAADADSAISQIKAACPNAVFGAREIALLNRLALSR